MNTVVSSTLSPSAQHPSRARRRHSLLGITAAVLAVLTAAAMSFPAAVADGATGTGGEALQGALNALVSGSDGPPGVIAVVKIGATQTVYRAGTGQVGQLAPLEPTDHIRLASVSKAYSGAVALSLVADHVLSLSDTVGKWLPSLPGEWHGVTLTELLQHTSGIQDFSGTTTFVDELLKDPQNPPPPETLLSFASPDLMFTPGTEYHYSNSDNIIVALMIQAATGQSYESELQSRVLGPLGLSQTSLPQGSAIPSPFISGYDLDPPKPPSDVTNFFGAGWSWASGGVIATPQDLDHVHPCLRARRDHVRGGARGAVHLSPGKFGAAGTGDQRRRLGCIPLRDELRHRLRPHGQHTRLHRFRRCHGRWVAIGDRANQRPDHSDTEQRRLA